MLTQQDTSITVIELLLVPLLCVDQATGGKEGKCKPRHCYSTNSTMTKGKQVHKGAAKMQVQENPMYNPVKASWIVPKQSSLHQWLRL